jgi:hypothetical protein
LSEAVVMYIRASFLTLAASVAFVTAANADHRVRKPRYLSPPIEIFTSAIDPLIDEDVWIDDEEDDEPTLDEMRERRKKWSRVNDEPWWLEDDEDFEDVEPVSKPAKKKAVTAKPKPEKSQTAVASPPKPKVKPERVTTTVPARKAQVVAKTVSPVAPKAQTAALTPKAVLPAAKKNPVALPKTASTPKPSGKTVGCTGGAAIVTGLGFGSVRPRVCTGDTYAYMATKSDGNYAIKLNASTGEVVDVAKLP